MIDPEYLRLVEDLADNPAELLRTRQVVPDRLLEHDPRVLPGARLPDAPDDRREGRGRRGAIENPSAPGAQLGVERNEALAKRGEGLWVVKGRGDVSEPSRERLPASLIQPVARELLDPAASALAKAGVVERGSSRADDRVAVGHEALVGQVVQRREQLAAGQIPGRAEHDERLGCRRCECHGAPPSTVLRQARPAHP
jgi:hypothetical protein